MQAMQLLRLVGKLLIVLHKPAERRKRNSLTEVSGGSLNNEGEESGPNQCGSRRLEKQY